MWNNFSTVELYSSLLSTEAKGSWSLFELIQQRQLPVSARGSCRQGELRYSLVNKQHLPSLHDSPRILLYSCPRSPRWSGEFRLRRAIGTNSSPRSRQSPMWSQSPSLSSSTAAPSRQWTNVPWIHAMSIDKHYIYIYPQLKYISIRNWVSRNFKMTQAKVLQNQNLLVFSA